LTRKFKSPWKLFFAGGLTFVASQVVHLPAIYGLTALFANDALPSPPLEWVPAFNAVVLGLMAGICEETARYILFTFFLKKTSTWNDGVLVGAGHGGIESIILGLGGGLTLINMVVMKNMDPALLGLPADQAALAQQQVAAFWASPAYMGFLGLFERVCAVCFHIVLSVMVLYSVINKKPVWFWLALLWHAIVDAGAVYLLPFIGAFGVEGMMGGVAVMGLLTLRGLRAGFDALKPLRDAQKAGAG
jgi:uncharacterized membrane protein YhfC